MAFRERECQGMSRKRAERKCRQEGDVVRGEGTEAEPLHGRGKKAFPQPVIRERDRARRGKEGEAVPPSLGQRQHMCVPPQERRAEERIADIVRDNRTDVQDQGERDC